MNTVAIASLFQLLASLLMSAQSNPNTPPAMVTEIVSLTNRTIQVAAQDQAMAKISFPISKNGGTWPRIEDLYHSAYLDAQGNYSQLGTGVALIAEDTSFGDLNDNGLDDAAAIVRITDSTGNNTFTLAALLNQGGIMFNIADAPLGNKIHMYDHHVVNGVIRLDMQINDQPRAIMMYRLVGKNLVKI